MKMCGYKGIVIIILMMTSLISTNALGTTEEPNRPDVNRMFDVQKEARINELVGLSPFEAFERLKTIEYQTNTELMYKAIYKAFHFRKSEMLTLACNYLGAPLSQVAGERLVSRMKDFTIVKRMFETFPEDATLMLVSRYGQSDAVTKGNIIQAAGIIAGGQDIRMLLIQALDDKSVYEEENPNSVGRPLRICDLAYNQLVLRYKIRHVLRTISPAHRIEDRDYHIDILKGML